MSANPVIRACDLVGGPTKLATAMQIRPPTVSQWISGERPVPAKRCPQIERITAGAVRCEELRPDIDWPALRGNQSVAPRAT